MLYGGTGQRLSSARDCVHTPVAVPCQAYIVDRRKAPDTIGEIHVPHFAKGTYIYSMGAKSEIEAKIALDGQNFQGSGYNTEVKRWETDSGWNVGPGFANQLQTYFMFNKYKMNGYQCPPTLTVKSDGWWGGATIGVGVGQWDGECSTRYELWSVPYSPGTYLRKTSGVGFNYGVGATVFGISLGSRTDWTTQNSFKIDFEQSALMCGNDGPIPVSSLVYKN
jgi:hypothetical protein